jgi:hypothetical protein
MSPLRISLTGIEFPLYRSVVNEVDAGETWTRWETFFICINNAGPEKFWPRPRRPFFWRYDGRRRLTVPLPFNYKLTIGRFYSDDIRKLS